MLNTCMRDIIVYTWRQTEYAYKVPELLRTLVGRILLQKSKVN